jgi:hypothetical protein
MTNPEQRATTGGEDLCECRYKRRCHVDGHCPYENGVFRPAGGEDEVQPYPGVVERFKTEFGVDPPFQRRKSGEELRRAKCSCGADIVEVLRSPLSAGKFWKLVDRPEVCSGGHWHEPAASKDESSRHESINRIAQAAKDAGVYDKVILPGDEVVQAIPARLSPRKQGKKVGSK